MIPVPNWAQFSEKGGIKGSVDWIPLEVIVTALGKLYENRESIKGQIYELTGIADIVRGDSKASETLGAQKIKAQFAGIRIRKLQNEVAEFASDILRIKGEMQAKLYEPETLIRKSGIFYTDNHDWVVDAILLLKSEKGFNWRIEVQADSMAQADYESEKEDRVKFLSMVTGYLTQALPIAGQIPRDEARHAGDAQVGDGCVQGGIGHRGDDRQAVGSHGGQAATAAQARPGSDGRAGQDAATPAKGPAGRCQGSVRHGTSPSKMPNWQRQKAQQDIEMKRAEMQLRAGEAPAGDGLRAREDAA